MRALSSVTSVMIHVAIGAAVLLGTARSGRSNPASARQISVVFPPPVTANPQTGSGLPAPQIPVGPEVPSIPLPSTVLENGMPSYPVFPMYTPSNAASGSGHSADPWATRAEEGPEPLTGPVAVYPDLLRQAGVQGQVVLEALVDTTGRVQGGSIAVISATHPGFIAPARQALLATLFRPARVGGKAVRMRIRMPFEFILKNGISRAN